MKTSLSIWSQFYYELSAEDAVLAFLRNGLDTMELADEHGLELLSRSEDVVATGRAFAAFLEEHHFSVPQGHLWLRIKLCEDADAMEKLFRWVDLYEAIGIRNMVLHCDPLSRTDLSFDERIARNADRLREMAAYIEGREICICLENLRGFTTSADHLLAVIDQIGSEQFGICLDTGHLNLTEKDQRAFILKAGKRLRALHIADNEGERDQHMMPFGRGNVDFEEVVRALREVDYEGLFNLEIPGESHVPMEVRAAKIRYVRECYDYLMR